MRTIKEMKEVKCTVYDIGEGFFVDRIISNPLHESMTTEFWIYHEDYGIKSLMFGLPFKAEVKGLDFDEYIELYKEDYMVD